MGTSELRGTAVGGCQEAGVWVRGYRGTQLQECKGAGAGRGYRDAGTGGARVAVARVQE